MPYMYADIPMHLVVAVMGLLPRGKGATILIVGGILMIFFAFLMTLASTRLHPAPMGGARRPRGNQPSARAMPVVLHARTKTMDDPRLGWSGPVIRGAADAGIQDMTVLAVEPERIVVRLDQCRSCERQGSRRPRCEPERRLFVRLARSAGMQVKVEELLCRRQGQGACVFELDRGVHR